jgi:hypothetical protein
MDIEYNILFNVNINKASRLSSAGSFVTVIDANLRSRVVYESNFTLLWLPLVALNKCIIR